jgi:hypothetical protein
MKNEFDEMPVIYSYTREDAIRDGVLIPVVANFAKEAGFVIPLAITCGVKSELEPNPRVKQLGQSLTGRMWDFLNVLRYEIRRRKDINRINFQMLVSRLDLVAVCHPGTDGEPVITVMLPGED